MGRLRLLISSMLALSVLSGCSPQPSNNASQIVEFKASTTNKPVWARGITLQDVQGITIGQRRDGKSDKLTKVQVTSSRGELWSQQVVSLLKNGRPINKGNYTPSNNKILIVRLSQDRTITLVPLEGVQTGVGDPNDALGVYFKVDLNSGNAVYLESPNGQSILIQLFS